MILFRGAMIPIKDLINDRSESLESSIDISSLVGVKLSHVNDHLVDKIRFCTPDAGFARRILIIRLLMGLSNPLQREAFLSEYVPVIYELEVDEKELLQITLNIEEKDFTLERYNSRENSKEYIIQSAKKVRTSLLNPYTVAQTIQVLNEPAVRNAPSFQYYRGLINYLNKFPDLNFTPPNFQETNLMRQNYLDLSKIVNLTLGQLIEKAIMTDGKVVSQAYHYMSSFIFKNTDIGQLWGSNEWDVNDENLFIMQRFPSEFYRRISLIGDTFYNWSSPEDLYFSIIENSSRIRSQWKTYIQD